MQVVYHDSANTKPVIKVLKQLMFFNAKALRLCVRK
jgi:hypothetical protein